MIFKKNIAIYAALLNVSVLLSQSAVEKNVDQRKRFSGVFLGFHTGYQHLLVKNSYVNLLGEEFGVFGVFGVNGLEYIAAHGHLVGGHVVLSHVFDNNFYLGTEISISYNFADRTSTNKENFGRAFSYKQNDEYALSLRLGGLFSTILCYGKAGFSLMHRTVTTKFLGLHTAFDELKYIDAERVSNRRLKGFFVGLGCAIPLNETFSLGFETEYAKYKHEKFSHPYIQDYALSASNLKFKMNVSIKI
ncbi:MAG: hypothetical protein CNLJKLNK_01434 [Holosporales bacterium]